MKILVALAFAAILASLAAALVYMMRSPAGRDTQDNDLPAPKGNMAKALAIRVGLSILLFICVLLSWKMGWIQPSGIPAGA